MSGNRPNARFKVSMQFQLEGVLNGKWGMFQVVTASHQISGAVTQEQSAHLNAQLEHSPTKLPSARVGHQGVPKMFLMSIRKTDPYKGL